jgi:ADP-heptose:LPS heptosyltransferase
VTTGHDMLVAAPERWDEAGFAVPAIRALMASGLGLGVLCKAEQKDFWETLGNCEVLAYPLKARPKVIAAEIPTGNWQAALVWEPGSAADAVKLAGIPRRIGPSERKLNKQLTHPLAMVSNPLDHRVRYYLSAVEEMGVNTLDPRFFAPAVIGIEPVMEAVLLCPDSDFGPTHEWSLDRWQDIGKRLLENGCRVTVAGVDGGRGLGKRLAADLGAEVEFFQASPLAGALPLLAVHGLVIAADGSLPHLAGHVGATCVTLFGPNDPAWKRPLGRRHAVVRRHVECAPCFLAKCPMDMRCQNELSVDRVWSVIQEKLGAHLSQAVNG